MIWSQLLGGVFFIAVIGALDSAKHARVGIGGYVLAIVSGAVVGAFCALAMWRLGETARTYASKLQSEVRQRWCFRALYASAVLWIAIAALLGKLVTAALLRLVI